MFTTNSVLSSVRKGDYAFKIDLQDAYFHVLFKQGVPVSGATIRSEHSPSGFYSIAAHGDRLSAPSGDLGDTISRRLVNSPPGPPSSTPTSGSALKYAGPRRLYPKQKEIQAGPDSGSPVSRNTFTSRLRGNFPSTVQSLGDSCSRTPSILPSCTILFRNLSGSVKAHEVRAVATSLQLFNKVDLHSVMKAGRWSSGGTFTSFYLRDLCPQADSLQRAGPIVAAGTSSGSPPPSQVRISFMCSFYAVFSGNLVVSFLLQKGGGGRSGGPQGDSRLTDFYLWESHCVCRLGARTDRLPSLFLSDSGIIPTVI